MLVQHAEKLNQYKAISIFIVPQYKERIARNFDISLLENLIFFLDRLFRRVLLQIFFKSIFTGKLIAFIQVLSF